MTKRGQHRHIPVAPARPGPRPTVRFGKVMLAVLGLGLILAGAWWWQSQGPAPVVPPLDLSAFDPKVRAALEQRIAAVRQSPRSAETWGTLGTLLWVYDARPAARACLLQAERLDPKNPRWPYYRALSLIIATPNDAIPLLRRTVELCGNSPEAPRYRLARILAEQGRWDEARVEWQALLAAHPDFAPARLLSAQDAQFRQEYDRAIELAKVCTDDPQTARAAWVLLASLDRQKNDLPAAAHAAQRAASLPEDQGFADPFDAEASLLRGDPRILSEQAHPLLAAGRLPQAAVLIERLEKEYPAYPDTWLLTGRLEYLRKNYPAAENALRRHLQLSPQSAQGLFQLGSVLLAQERWLDAAAAFQTATQLKPDFGPAHFNRALALGRAGQPRPAMEAFKESLRHSPERIESYLFLAELYLRFGERDSALALLQQARAINPADRRLAALEAKLRPNP